MIVFVFNIIKRVEQPLLVFTISFVNVIIINYIAWTSTITFAMTCVRTIVGINDINAACCRSSTKPRREGKNLNPAKFKMSK